jgi:hypothetical protein
MIRVSTFVLVSSLLIAGCFSRIDVDFKADAAAHDGASDASDSDGATDGSDTTDGDEPSDADKPSDAGDASVPDPRHPIVECAGRVRACADGMDNDEDGLVDSDDPDCFGPCDNNESSYYPDHPGAGGGWVCELDCYFDGDYGSGGGDCSWTVRCDPLNPGAEWAGADCSFDPELTSFDCASHFEAQYEERVNCQSNCELLTPRGCDCFGCCHFPTASNADRHLLIGSKPP